MFDVRLRQGRMGRRMAQASTSKTLANVKFVFFFYKNITDPPRLLIEEGLKSPTFVAKLQEQGFTNSVPVQYLADTFPFYEGVSTPMPEPVQAIPIGRYLHMTDCVIILHVF